MAHIINEKTNMTQCGTDPSVDANWDSCVAELRGYVLGNVSMVKGYTAVGGYCRSHDICWDSFWFRAQSFSEEMSLSTDACDDCCHMPVLNQCERTALPSALCPSDS